MTKADNPKQPISFPAKLKKELSDIATKTITQQSLVILATKALVAKYKVQGSFAFVDIPLFSYDSDQVSRQNISFPEELNKDLLWIKKETRRSKNEFVIMATAALVENYKKYGDLIFMGCLSPEIKK